MRVLFISDVDQDFGAPKSLYYLIRGLKENYNVEPIVVTLSKGNLNKKLLNIGIANYEIPKVRSLLFQRSFLKKMIAQILSPYLSFMLKLQMKKSIKNIEECIDMDSIDVVHTNVSINAIGAHIAKKWGKPHVWHMREDLIGKVKYGIFQQKKYIRLINDSNNNIIYISHFMKQKWLDLGISVDSQKVIYNGITDVLSKDNYNSSKGKISYVVVGSLSEAKGQAQILEAINLLTTVQKEKIHLTIIGTGDEHYIKYLKSLVQKYNLLSIVSFTGYDPDVSNNLRDFDVGLMTSKAEAFGRTTVEYMMAGLPVIASNTGANPEIVKHGENGLLYELDDISSLKDGIATFISQPEKVKQMGVFAKKDSNERFSANLNAENVYALLKQVVNDAKF